MMEGHQEAAASPYGKRPIILSPPPLEQAQRTGGGFVGVPESGGCNGRQASVGYNLQHEFETLTADLDLDLRNNKGGLLPPREVEKGNLVSQGQNQSQNQSQSLLSGGLLHYPFGEFGAALSGIHSSLLRDDTLSPSLGASTASTSATPQHHSSILPPLLGSNGSFLPPLASIPNRPQSANDFSCFFTNQQPTHTGEQQQPVQPPPQQQQQQQAKSSNLYQELILFSNFVEGLSPQDSLVAVEYLCNHLPIDFLVSFKTQLDNQLLGQANPPSAPNFGVLPTYDQKLHELLSDMDSLNLGNSLSNDSGSINISRQTPPLQQPKPKVNPFKSQGHYIADQKAQRPKSADPSLHNNARFTSNGYPQAYDVLERSKSPTSHLFEKTNFLQLAAANSNSPSGTHSKQSHTNSDEPLDISAHTALKLGALATINSRVALDSNKKGHIHGGHSHSHPHSQFYLPSQNRSLQSTGPPLALFEDTINRSGNSSSVPLSTQNSTKSPNTLGRGKKTNDTDRQSTASGTSSPQVGSSNTSMPADIANPDLLNNIPAWLKLLRLHKYTDCLKDIPWQDLIELDDPQLEERGVKALGARRKLLKAFAAVKKAI